MVWGWTFWLLVCEVRVCVVGESEEIWLFEYKNIDIFESVDLKEIDSSPIPFQSKKSHAAEVVYP